jgi:two-component system sensor histidine kinase/response regulator
MGGSVGVSSKPGQGSRFWFTATAAEAGGDDAMDALRSTFAGLTPQAVHDSLAGHHLLVVEDECHQPGNRPRTARASMAWTADTAENGQCRRWRLVGKQHYDLILMDMQMPKHGRPRRRPARSASCRSMAQPADHRDDRQRLRRGSRALHRGGHERLPVAKPVDPNDLKLLLLRYLAS